MFSNFSVVKLGEVLHVGSVLMTLQNTGVDKCRFECMRHARCRSINVVHNEDICQLCNKSADDYRDNVTTSKLNGWTYFSTSYSSQLVGMSFEDSEPFPKRLSCRIDGR